MDFLPFPSLCKNIFPLKPPGETVRSPCLRTHVCPARCSLQKVEFMLMEKEARMVVVPDHLHAARLSSARLNSTSLCLGSGGRNGWRPLESLERPSRPRKVLPPKLASLPIQGNLAMTTWLKHPKKARY